MDRDRLGGRVVLGQGDSVTAYIETWGFDLRTAEGYQAWRDAGGRWPDETPERMKAYEEAAGAGGGEVIHPIEERLRYAVAKTSEFETAARNYERTTHPESVPARTCREQAAKWRSVAEALRAEMEAKG